MERVLSVYLPGWDVELIQRRWRRGGARREGRGKWGGWPAILLVNEAAGIERVVRCCAQARQTGVQEGMTLAEARAVSGPAVYVSTFDAATSRAALAALAKWCWRFSPLVTVDEGADGLLMDVTGVAHLFGGEQLILAELAGRLARMGFSTRLAIGPTVGAAWAMARFSRERMNVVGGEIPNSEFKIQNSQVGAVEQAIARLPVAALRLVPNVCFELEQVGVTWIGDLLRLKRNDLRARFGDLLLQRLDQALGRKAELIVPLREEDPICVRRIFEGETTQLEAVMLTVRELVTEMCARLLLKESGVRGVRLELKRARAMPVTHELVLGRASRDAKHLWELMRLKIEKMHMGYGVEAVEVRANWCEKLRHTQDGQWGTGEEENELDRELEGFLDVVANRWGPGRVVGAKAVESYVPEAAMGWRELRNTNHESQNTKQDGGMLLVDRPGVLMGVSCRGEPIEVLALLPDRPPSWMRWRGEEFLLHAGAGPERMVTEWWKEEGDATAGKTRDYFKVQTQAGSWLWVYRELETGKWFVQGVW